MPRKTAASTSGTVQGVGESKRFGGLHARFFDGRDYSKLHTNGLPIPEELWGKLPYAMTDEGAAERQREAIKKSGVPPSKVKVQVTRDHTAYDRIRDDDKKLEKYRDDLSADFGEVEIPTDPMKPLVDKFTPTGHRGRFFGPLAVKEQGMIRGGIEYKPLLTKNEETGEMERVMCGGMFLATAPTDQVKAVERHFERMGAERAGQVTEKVREQADKIMAESDFVDTARRRRMLDDLVGAQPDNPEQADQELLEHESA